MLYFIGPLPHIFTDSIVTGPLKLLGGNPTSTPPVPRLTTSRKTLRAVSRASALDNGVVGDDGEGVCNEVGEEGVLISMIGDGGTITIAAGTPNGANFIESGTHSVEVSVEGEVGEGGGGEISTRVNTLGRNIRGVSISVFKPSPILGGFTVKYTKAVPAPIAEYS